MQCRSLCRDNGLAEAPDKVKQLGCAGLPSRLYARDMTIQVRRLGIAWFAQPFLLLEGFYHIEESLVLPAVRLTLVFEHGDLAWIERGAKSTNSYSTCKACKAYRAPYPWTLLRFCSSSGLCRNHIFATLARRTRVRCGASAFFKPVPQKHLCHTGASYP